MSTYSLKVYKLNGLIFWLIRAIDSKKHVKNDVIIEQVNNGTILEFLKKEIDIDLSMLSDSDRIELIEQWQRDVNAIDGESDLGIRNNGLCLLIGYLTQDINILTLDKRI